MLRSGSNLDVKRLDNRARVSMVKQFLRVFYFGLQIRVGRFDSGPRLHLNQGLTGQSKSFFVSSVNQVSTETKTSFCLPRPFVLKLLLLLCVVLSMCLLKEW